MKVAHYLNQFFAGLGAEESAGREPLLLQGPVGPGRGLAGAGLEIAYTLVCGDDYFARYEEAALAVLVGWLEADPPRVLVCGPAFGSGRYGYACGTLAREAARRGIPVVSGMHPDNPGVPVAAGAAYIVPTEVMVTGMRAALPAMAGLAGRLAAGEPIGSPADEGYLPRGVRHNVRADRCAAERAVEMLLAKLAGRPYASEAAPRPSPAAPPAPPVRDLGAATVALVTESGCVPCGNPDRLESSSARAWFRYPIDGLEELAAGAFEAVHAGFDTGAANADPDRLVPLDAMRGLQRAGRFARLHEFLYTTTGNNTPVERAAAFGREIAAELHEADVQAVVLTGT